MLFSWCPYEHDMITHMQCESRCQELVYVYQSAVKHADSQPSACTQKGSVDKSLRPGIVLLLRIQIMFHHAEHAGSIIKIKRFPSHNNFQHPTLCWSYGEPNKINQGAQLAPCSCCLHASHCQCLQAGQPERQPSDAYDGYEASLSERHSDATSDTTQPEAAPHPHQPLGRPLTLSPSIRSSAASTDDLLSPTLAQHLTNGFTKGGNSAVGHQPNVPTDVPSSSGSAINDPPARQQSDLHSLYSGSAAAGLGEGGAGFRAQWGRLQAGFGHIGQSLTGGVFGREPHPSTLSPELGVFSTSHCLSLLSTACM